MQSVALTRYLTRAVAIMLVVVAHAFALNLAHPPSVALGLAYGVSLVCLAIAAGLLWRRSMN